MLAWLAHSLQELSAVYQGIRGVKILLVLGEVPQALSYCVDSETIRLRNDLTGGQYVISEWIQTVPQPPRLLCP
jgi:hypothetical protein